MPAATASVTAWRPAPVAPSSGVTQLVLNTGRLINQGVELGLSICYGVVRQAGGEAVAGEVWEFWGYWITALLVPVAAFWWSILERTRWSNLILGAVGLTIFVMLVRMEQIWDGALAV